MNDIKFTSLLSLARYRNNSNCSWRVRRSLKVNVFAMRIHLKRCLRLSQGTAVHKSRNNSECSKYYVNVVNRYFAQVFTSELSWISRVTWNFKRMTNCDENFHVPRTWHNIYIIFYYFILVRSSCYWFVSTFHVLLTGCSFSIFERGWNYKLHNSNITTKLTK